MSSDVDRLRLENDVLRRAVAERDTELPSGLKAALEIEMERLRRETTRHSGKLGEASLERHDHSTPSPGAGRQSRAERRR